MPVALAEVGEGPITVVNLFALREVAEYGDGRSDGGTGLEAMLRYAAVSGARLAAVGGQFLAQGVAPRPLWGDDESWDILVVASYPGVEAFLDLLRDPEYRDAFVHRRAAVARQRVLVSPTIA